jgi:hypothetical protein
VIDPASLSADDRDRLVTNLRDLLHWINSYGDGEIRAFAEDLAKALERVSPVDVLERYGWLLGNAWPNLPEGEPEDFAEREKLVAEKREAAARMVLDKVELDRVLDYSASVQYVGVFGHAVGKVVRNQDEDERVLDTALARKPLNEGFVVGYAMGRVEVAGREWVSKQAGRLQRGGSTPEALALLYLGVPEDGQRGPESPVTGPPSNPPTGREREDVLERTPTRRQLPSASCWTPTGPMPR